MDALEKKESLFQAGNEPWLQGPAATILVTTLAELTRIIFSATITRIIIRNEIIPTLWKVNITYYSYWWMKETAWGATWVFVIEGFVPVSTLLLHPKIRFKALTRLQTSKDLSWKYALKYSQALTSLSPSLTVVHVSQLYCAFMEVEFAYVENAYWTDFSFSGPYLERRSRHQPVALSVLCRCV